MSERKKGENNNDSQNTTQTTKNLAKRIPPHVLRKSGEFLQVPLVTSVLLLM